MKLKFQESFQTEVFATASGHIRIDQTYDMSQETFALLTPEQAEQLLTALPKLIELARLELVEGGDDE